MPARAAISRRLEDYLEAVLTLTRASGAARVSDIAKLLGVSKCSVTAALKHLGQSGLVDYDPYQLARLTPRGQVLAGRIRRKHDALTQFLVDVLNIDEPTAQANACRMEHVVDDFVLRRLGLLAEFVGSAGGSAGSGGWVKKFSTYCAARDAT